MRALIDETHAAIARGELQPDPVEPWWERRRENELTPDYLGRVLDEAGLPDLARNARAAHYDDSTCQLKSPTAWRRSGWCVTCGARRARSARRPSGSPSSRTRSAAASSMRRRPNQTAGREIRRRLPGDTALAGVPELPIPSSSAVATP
jgi:hypothetical protein